MIGQPRQAQLGFFPGGDIHAHRQDQRGVFPFALEPGMLPDHFERASIFAADVAFFLKMRQAARHQFRQVRADPVGAFFGQQRDESPPLQLLQAVTGDRLPVRVDHQNLIVPILGQDNGLRGVQNVRDEIALLDDLAHALGEIARLLGHLGV